MAAVWSGSAGALHEGSRASMLRSGSAGALIQEARGTNAASMLRPENAGTRREEAQNSIAASKPAISSLSSLRGTRSEKGRPGSQSSSFRHSTRRSRDLYDTSWHSPTSGRIVSTSGLTSAGSASRGIAREAVANARRGLQSRGFEVPDLIVGVGIDIVKRADAPLAASSSGSGGASKKPRALARGISTCADQDAGAVCAAAVEAEGASTAAPEGETAPSAAAASSGTAGGRRASASSQCSEDLWELADRFGMLSGFLSGSLLWDGGALHRAFVQGRLPALPPAHTCALSPAASQADQRVALQPPGLALPGSVTRAPSRGQRCPPLSAEALHVRGSACGSAAALRPATLRQAAELQDLPLRVAQDPPLQIVPLSDWLSDVTAGLLARTSQALAMPGSLPSDDEFKMLLDASPIDPVKLSIRGRSLTQEPHDQATRPRLGKNTWKQQTFEFGGDSELPFPVDAGKCEDLLIWRIRLAKRHARRRHTEFGRPISLPPPMTDPYPAMQFNQRKVPDEMDSGLESSSTGSTMTPPSTSVSSAGFGGGSRQEITGTGALQSHLTPPSIGAASFFTPGSMGSRAGPGRSQAAPMGQAMLNTNHLKLPEDYMMQGRNSRRNSHNRTAPTTALEKATAAAIYGDTSGAEMDDDEEDFGHVSTWGGAGDGAGAGRRRSSVTGSSSAVSALSQANPNLLHPSLRFAEAADEEGEMKTDAERSAAAAAANRRESLLYEEQIASKARARKKRHTMHAAFARAFGAPDEADEDEEKKDASGTSPTGAETPLQEAGKTPGKPAPWRKGDPLFRIKSGDGKVLGLGTTNVLDEHVDITVVDAEGRFVKSLLPPPPYVDMVKKSKDRGSIPAGEFSRQNSRNSELGEDSESEAPTLRGVANEPHPCGGVLGCLAQEFRQCLEEAGFYAGPEKCQAKDGYKESSRRMAGLLAEMRLRNELKKDLESATSEHKSDSQEAEADADFQVSLVTDNWQRRAKTVEEGLEKEEALLKEHLDMRKQRYSQRLQAWSSKIVSKSYDPHLWSRKAELCRYKLRGLAALGEYTKFMGQQRASSVPAKGMKPGSAAAA